MNSIAQEIALDHLADSVLLDERQAAAALNIAPATLAIWRSVGRYDLPYIKIGRAVRYRAGDLKSWIAKRSRQHAGQGG